MGGSRVLGCGDFVEELLGQEEVGRAAPLRGVDEVLAEVSREWKVAVEEVLGPSRERRISKARREFYVRAHKRAGQAIRLAEAQ